MCVNSNKPGVSNLSVIQQTVRRRLKRQGCMCRKPYFGHTLTNDHRRLRLEWAMARAQWYHTEWSSILFLMKVD